MIPKPPKSVYYRIEFAVIWIFLKLIRPLPFEQRIKLGGKILGFLIANLRSTKSRIDINLRHIFPDMPRDERREITQKVGRTFGPSIIETLNGDTYVRQKHLFHPSGPGLDHINSTIASNTGFILVSSHFGQSDAARHYLKGIGVEVGAVYRTSNNPHFDKLFQKQISYSGSPNFAKGRRGTMQLVKHLRDGGNVSILLDQKYDGGKDLDFLGHKTRTSDAPAEMALRYNLPMIPVYGIRRENSLDIDIVFEAPIPHTDAETMTQAANDSLAAQVFENPGQWYWLHQRWNFRD